MNKQTFYVLMKELLCTLEIKEYLQNECLSFKTANCYAKEETKW